MMLTNNQGVTVGLALVSTALEIRRESYYLVILPGEHFLPDWQIKQALGVSSGHIFWNHGFEQSTLRIKVLHNNQWVLDMLSFGTCMVMNSWKNHIIWSFYQGSTFCQIDQRLFCHFYVNCTRLTKLHDFVPCNVRQVLKNFWNISLVLFLGGKKYMSEVKSLQTETWIW